MGKRKLIDNSYVAEWAIDLDGEQPDQYAAYASKDLNKGDIVMECLIPFEWLYTGTSAMKSYRIHVDKNDRVITVIARNAIKQDEELRWLYIGKGKEI